MTSTLGKFFQYYNVEEQKILVDKFGTTEKKELNKLMKKYVLSTINKVDDSNLSVQEQILLEKLAILKEERPLKLRKLKAQAEILESKRKFLYNFQTVMSDSGSQTLEKSTWKKYGFGDSENYQENIQLKKNFYINKLGDGEYCGCCKICQNFSTAICTTSKEAEGDIELHLETVHQTGLYQK